MAKKKDDDGQASTPSNVPSSAKTAVSPFLENNNLKTDATDDDDEFKMDWDDTSVCKTSATTTCCGRAYKANRRIVVACVLCALSAISAFACILPSWLSWIPCLFVLVFGYSWLQHYGSFIEYDGLVFDEESLLRGKNGASLDHFESLVTDGDGCLTPVPESAPIERRFLSLQFDHYDPEVMRFRPPNKKQQNPKSPKNGFAKDDSGGGGGSNANENKKPEKKEAGTTKSSSANPSEH